MLLKFPLKDVICDGISFKCFCHTSVWVGFTDGTFEAIFVHQTLDLFEVHKNRRVHVKKSHMDAPDTFIIAFELVSLKDKIKSGTVFPFRPAYQRN